MLGKLGVIIPYRPNELRERHLEEVVPLISNYLRNTRINNSIVVVDQVDKGSFNRGMLCNIGVDYFAKNDSSITHFCFHDVDLIPIKADYSLTDLPVRVSTKITGGERDGTSAFFGGVMLVNKEVYYVVNGHSNVFYGWGGEDDDFKHRVDLSGIQVDIREYGEFIHLDHPIAERDMKAHAWKMNRREEMRIKRFDFHTDGMSSLEYFIESDDKMDLCSYLSVITNGSDVVVKNSSVYSGWGEGLYKNMSNVSAGGNKEGSSLAVVICTKSNVELLKQICSVCLESTLVSQLIIVDNKSNDGTVSYIESLKDDKIILVKNDKNVGCIKARNQGIVLSTSFYTMVIDDDQIPILNTFARYLDALKYYDVVGCDLQVMNFKTGLTEVGTKGNFTYVGAGGMCMRTCHWVKLGLFDEIFSPAYFEDPDIVEKAKSIGLMVGYVDNNDIKHIGHSTLSGKSLDFNPEDIIIRNRKIFTSRYKDLDKDHIVKNNRVKVLYIVTDKMVDSLLSNKNLFDSYRYNFYLDVRVFADGDRCSNKICEFIDKYSLVSVCSNGKDIIKPDVKSEHIVYRNISHKPQIVYLNSGVSRLVKPGGVLSDKECSTLRSTPSFRFYEWDKGRTSLVTKKMSLINFVKKFKPHIIYHPDTVDLGAVNNIKGIQSFKRFGLVSRVVDATFIKGYNIIAAIG